MAGGVEKRHTPLPWRIAEPLDESGFWIEGPEGSAGTERFPADRRVVCEFKLYSEEGLDSETRANADLIIERVNGGGSQ